MPMPDASIPWEHGLDLPIVVQEAGPIIRQLAGRAENVSFHGVDATNYTSLKTALQDCVGPLCIFHGQCKGKRNLAPEWFLYPEQS